MAAASLVRPGKRAMKIDDVIRAMKAASLHRRGWVSSDRLASLLDIEASRLATPLAHAQEAGLLDLRRNLDGRLGVKLTKLSGPRGDDRRTAPVFNDELDDCPFATLVRAVAGMPSTAPLIDDLADTLEVTVDEIYQEIAEAERGDWLATWSDCPEGPAVCLSPLSATRLGLSISEDRSRWLRIGQADFSDADPSRGLTESSCSDPNLSIRYFDTLASTDDPPEQLVIDGESAQRRAVKLEGVKTVYTPAICSTDTPKRRGAWSEATVMSLLESECLDYDEELRIPRPVEFIGFGRSWPVMVEGSNPPRPWTRKEGPCPCCGGVPISFRAACLVCDAIGVQPLLDRIKASPPAPEFIPIQSHRADTVRTSTLRGGR